MSRTWPLSVMAIICGVLQAAPVRAQARGIDDDVNIDHAFWMPTAISQRAGTWKLSATELVLFGASYAITDRLGATVGAMPPVDDEILGWLTVKWQLLRAERVHVAVQASTLVGHDSNRMDNPPNPQTYVMPTLGAVATLCIDQACRSLLNGYGHGQLGSSGDAEYGGYGLAGSVIAHIAGGGDAVAVKSMVEIQALRAYRGDGANDGNYAWAGVRMSWRSFGLDLGLVKTFGGGSETARLVPLLPWIKLAYRIQ